MRRLANNFSVLTSALCAALILAMALPGQHRILFPQAYGLVEIAPRIWTDTPARAQEIRDLTAAAQTKVASFFQDAPPTPNVILCATRQCARDFRISGNGLSVAYFAVMVAPGGITIGTLTHEMTHARLHRSIGWRNLMKPPFPTWFDEGLATYVANHPKSSAPVSIRSRAKVRNAERRYQWRRVTREIGVGRSYFAAAAEVQSLERQLGRAGLLELIARVDAGGRFNSLIPKN